MKKGLHQALKGRYIQYILPDIKLAYIGNSRDKLNQMFEFRRKVLKKLLGIFIVPNINNHDDLLIL